MINRDLEYNQMLDRVCAIAFAVALLAALSIYFIFYLPGITQAIRSGVLPEKGILWLEIHIAAYWISSSLYLTGLLLAVIYFLGKATTRFPWIEAAMIIATILTVTGLITGILFSKPAWNVWWVWDAKHIVVLLNTLLLLGISPLVVMSRKFSNPMCRSGALVILLLVAVASCFWSFLIRFFFPIIHPQWFPYVLFQ